MEVETGNAFASTAIKLLNEYIADIKSTQNRIRSLLARAASLIPAKFTTENELARAAQGVKGPPAELKSLQVTLALEERNFMSMRTVYITLVRKVSQWLEHGKEVSPHLMLEVQMKNRQLEILLDELPQDFQAGTSFIGFYRH